MVTLPDVLAEIPAPSVTVGIPRVLNQVFFPGWDGLPEVLRTAHVPNLRERNPAWAYRLFDAADALAFIDAHYGPAMRAVFEQIDPAYYAARADLLRYLVIYAEGGVYLDMKSDILLPLKSVVAPDDVYLLSQWPADPAHRYGAAGRHPSLAHIPGGEYQQWFLIAAPRHPYLRAVIELVVANLIDYRLLRDGIGAQGVFKVTGPIAFSLAIHPIVSDHPHRVIRAIEDGLMRYSIFPDQQGHKDAAHYTLLRRPIVPRNKVLDLSSTALLIAGRKSRRAIDKLAQRTRTSG